MDLKASKRSRSQARSTSFRSKAPLTCRAARRALRAASRSSRASGSGSVANFASRASIAAKRTAAGSTFGAGTVGRVCTSTGVSSRMSSSRMRSSLRSTSGRARRIGVDGGGGRSGATLVMPLSVAPLMLPATLVFGWAVEFFDYPVIRPLKVAGAVNPLVD